MLAWNRLRMVSRVFHSLSLRSPLALEGYHGLRRSIALSLGVIGACVWRGVVEDGCVGPRLQYPEDIVCHDGWRVSLPTFLFYLPISNRVVD